MSSEAELQPQTTTEITPLLPTNHPTTDSEHPTMSSALFWKIGAIYGATAVGLGAFGAHGLKTRISDPAKIANWTTAAHYQLLHSAVMLVAAHNPVASACFVTGMTMFSGSIYALTLDSEKKYGKIFGPVTPIGGLFLIAGWLALAFGSRGRGVAGFRGFK